MIIGRKLFPDVFDLVPKYKDIFDYFELTITDEVTEADLDKIKSQGVETVIHSPHIRFGFDIGDINNHKKSKELLDKSIWAADYLKSKYIVVHAECRHDLNSINHVIKFFKDNFDSRLVVENTLHKYKDYVSFGSYEDMKKIIEESGVPLLFDFDHCICTANQLGLDPHEYIRSFMKLKPVMFHASGLRTDVLKDEHLDFVSRKDYNDYRYLKYIGKDQFVTFETSMEFERNKERQIEDIKFVRDIVGDNND